MKNRMNGRFWLYLLTGTALAFSSALSAAGAADDDRVYRWTDKDGVSHYGDSFPPEAASAGHSVLNKHGVEVYKVSGALSQEQIDEELWQEALADEAERKMAAARLRDKVLISTYLSVEEIEALRDRRVEMLGGRINITQKYLTDLRNRIVKLEREAQRYSPYSIKSDAKPIDEKLARELSDTLHSINLYEKTLSKSMDEQRQVREKFAADITRFSELRGLSKNN